MPPSNHSSSHSASYSAAIPYWRLSSLYFCYFSVLGSLLPYWGLYLKDLGFGAGAIGALMAILTGTRIIAPNLWGYLADKSGRRLDVIRLGAGLGFLCFLGIFAVESFVGVALVIFAFTFFWNAILAQFEVVTLAHLGTRRTAYSRVRLWGSVGFILLVVGLGQAFDHLSVRYLPLFISLLLFSIFLCSLLIPKPPTLPTTQERPPLLGLVLQPAAIAFLLVTFLLQVAHGPYYVFFSLYLEDQGYNRALTGQLWALGVLAEIALFLVMHRLFARFSLRAILLVTLALSSLRWLLIGQLIDSLAWLVVAQCLHAFSFGAAHACAIEMVQRLFRGHEGRGQALYASISFGGGSALGAGLSGLLWDQVGAAWTYGFAALLCMLAFFVALIGFRSKQFD